jgi:hypothetical protein
MEPFSLFALAALLFIAQAFASDLSNTSLTPSAINPDVAQDN